VIDSSNLGIEGRITIRYGDTKEVICTCHNDVLYGNMAIALAHALLGNPSGMLCYLALGNGGAFVNSTGAITYKPSLGGANSMVKNPAANLYNTVYVKKLSGYINGAETSVNQVYVPNVNYSTNYEDVVVDITLTYDEPPVGVLASSTIQQCAIDNSPFIGQPNTGPLTTLAPNKLVFNEIGLFVGTPNVFPGAATVSTAEVNTFVNQQTDFSRSAAAKSKLMVTHAIFHPVQKSANRAIEIIYTLRIQMGAL
jgi:hypothetical protein